VFAVLLGVSDWTGNVIILCYKVPSDMRCFKNKDLVGSIPGFPTKKVRTMLTLQHQPKLSLRNLLRGSSSAGASATRSFGSSKICSSAPPSIGPSLFPKKYLRNVERGRFDGVLKPSTCCSQIRAFPACCKLVFLSMFFHYTHGIA
jgi:hypothetical protein